MCKLHNPTISIIVPVYNTSSYLEKCLDSIYNQTFKDYQLICVDDGSSDNSLQILKKYQNKIKNLKNKDYYIMAGVAGVEPTSAVLETVILPLNYTPMP